MQGKTTRSHIVPVVGPGAITFGRGDDMLQLWLAQKVDAKCHLQFQASDLPKTLQQVVDEQRRGGATLQERRECLGLVHLYVYKLLTSPGMYPGVTLYRLASIKDFQLFLTTSFDPLLARAVEAAQPAARPADWVCAISFRDGFRDLPSSFGELPYACVYHLLGKICKAPDWLFGTMKRSSSCVSSISNSALPGTSPRPCTTHICSFSA
jgi:hypothetical protein